MLRLRLPTESGMDVSEHAAKHGTKRVLGDQVGDRRLDFVESSAEVAEGVLLEAVDGDRHLRLGSFSGCEGFLGEPFTVLELSGGKCEGRLGARGEPLLSGLPELV